MSGPTVAFRNSVALGAGAQARSQVAVAIGVRAMTSGLHGPSDRRENVIIYDMTVTTISNNTGHIVSVSTNYVANRYTYDPAMYESLPYGRGTYKLSSTEYRRLDDENIEEVKTFVQNIAPGQIDPRYATPEELDMYDVIFNPGQPNVNYKDAIYSISLGYRALCAGYHSMALGHYSRAYRPHVMAIGPSTHVKSEGSIAMAYYSTIETNSPFCLALGSRINIDSGMTNAIVIGVPSVNYDKRYKEGYKQTGLPQVYSSNPKAMKSNSINFVFQGQGLKDVFVDDVPMTDRLASDVQMIGNLKSNGKLASADQIEVAIRKMVGIPSEDASMVMFSAEGGLRIYTKEYIEAAEEWDLSSREMETVRGSVDEIYINGESLPTIIRRIAGADVVDYKGKVSRAADAAKSSINSATNMQDVKNALNAFFDAIK